ncbi:hypothetical protein [Streptomyces sp. NPDC058252]|uniref:hypothetical protein n=1 Tax=Streptomyces sp. NPDC058252 TaxID=3346405 RepID=UPI0036E06185
METRYLARLRFVANGPAVEGEWALASTARARYTEWVGIYSKDPEVVVWLIEKTGGRERALRTWTAQGETVS